MRRQTTNGGKSILRVEDVSVTRDYTPILRNINWTVGNGERWVLLGPNGAGKTTLLNVICGYTWPTTGTVHVLGQRYGDTDIRELRKRIALVTDALIGMIQPHLTGFEILITGPRAHLNIFDPPSPAEERQARSVAKLMLVDSLLEKPFLVMSTGERKRLLIARALMFDPDLVILDEPCAGLDLGAREFVLQTIDELARSRRVPAVVFTTHHVEEILPPFTRTLLLHRGEVRASGTVDEVLTSKLMSEVYQVPLEVSHRNGIWTALPKR